MGPTFSAIDFETADYGRDSACSVAIVRVVDGEIVERWYRFIQPPRRQFVFTYLPRRHSRSCGPSLPPSYRAFPTWWPTMPGSIARC